MSETYPDELRYTVEHEWVLIQGERARVGITAFAQAALGDIVYVSLPAVGDAIEAGSSIGEIESTKSVSELYAPVAGEVVEINAALEDAPELINSDPYGAGWMFEVVLADSDQSSLLTADAYAAGLG